MTNGRKSTNLVKNHELICLFIRLYLVPLPPYSSIPEALEFHALPKDACHVRDDFLTPIRILGTFSAQFLSVAVLPVSISGFSEFSIKFENFPFPLRSHPRHFFHFYVWQCCHVTSNVKQ